MSTRHQVLIVGGGTAGITVAAILKRRAPGTDIAIIEPSHEHYYQPAFTLVGAGVYPLARTRRAEKSLIPVGVRWICDAALTFEPERNIVRIKNGDMLTYDYLVVCTSVKLDWGKIAGLVETLGRNGVCSNYSPAHVTYTWDCLQRLQPGSRAVFTQPPLPFKCPGAPQKIAYLTADHLQRRGSLKECNLDFYVHAPVIFTVPFFARECIKIAARYGINVHYQHNLVAVDGAAKTATFEKVDEQNKGDKVTVPFDMLHVSPPQSPAEEIKSSPLANAAGWIEVNQNSMQHTRYPNVLPVICIDARHAKAALKMQINKSDRNDFGLPSFCIGCGSKAANSSGHQRRLINLHSRTKPNSRRPAGINVPAGTLALVRSPLALRCSREQNALHTLIRQRHLTPSCGGQVPTAERTPNPARVLRESLRSLR
jgi:sulfide:quinone oxidoreductase